MDRCMDLNNDYRGSDYTLKPTQGGLVGEGFEEISNMDIGVLHGARVYVSKKIPMVFLCFIYYLVC